MSQAILSLDIETGGCLSTHPLISIGTCLYVDNIFVKNRFTFPFSITDFEPRCKKFWDANLDVLAELQKDKHSSISEFAEFLDEIDALYPDLTIITDNPTFDVGFINHHFEKTLDRNPISYRLNSDNDYRCILCLETFAYSLTIKQDKNNLFKNTSYGKLIEKYKIKVSKRTCHMPDDDAQYNLELFLEFKNELSKE
jgi:DNA polymerase III alpha subunit (gram-positive type)